MTNRPCIAIPSDLDVGMLINGCPALPKQVQPLLLAILELAQREEVCAVACSVLVTEGTVHARLNSSRVAATINSFNIYLARNGLGVMLVTHLGAVEAPPDALAHNHIRFVRDSSGPEKATVWLVPAGSTVAGIVVELAGGSYGDASRLVETAVPVRIVDAVRLLKSTHP